MIRFRCLGINSVVPFHESCISDNIIFRNYAFKSDLKIKWNRPEKIPCYKPEKSGDLKAFPELDKKQVLLEFRESKELQSADENVKKLFTLEFAPKKYANRVVYNEIVEKVNRHEYDRTSIEAKIAKWTGVIRAQQEHLDKFPRNLILKVILKELIEKRKKHLKHLRRWDYKKFEWLIENLDIVYKPHPTESYTISRKDSLRKLTDRYCESIKEDRLKLYKLKLESEHPAFLAEKISCLKFIRDEQIACGVEVTVTDDEINEVQKQLDDLKKKNEEMNKQNENE